MERRQQQRRRALVAVVLGSFALVAACSSNEPAAPPSTGAGTTQGTGITDPLADAKSVSVVFFEAKAVNDYDRALAASSGAAALTVRWARDVNAIQATAGTPYEVPSVPAPNVRVQIDSLDSTGNGTYRANGFVELGFRPSGVASTTTTTAPNTSSNAPTTVFVTDMHFTTGAGHLVLDDFRLDDTPYPISQLYIDATKPPSGTTGATGTTSTTAGGTTTSASPDAATDVQLRLAHRDLDGSVQYDVGFTSQADGTKATTASFFSGATTPPPSTATGSPVTLYSDLVGDGATAPVLGVRLGAFPGGPGILRVAFTGPDGSARGSADLVVPPFPELVAEPVNQIRDRLSSTTSSSSSSTSSTSSTTTSESTTTTAPTSSTSSTSSSTTSSSSSTTSSSTTTSSPPAT
jgi:hypothetical protein